MTDQAPFAVPPPDRDRAEAAAYICDLTGALAQLARRNGFNTLGYLLDMAKLEAENIKGANGRG